mmetsp:Transcript_37029/g.37688  ORF Transcript_37029/g.37688 Transcript_37029/m.37688 type:complete len:211 (+) Transcript_37029:206-838(+)
MLPISVVLAGSYVALVTVSILQSGSLEIDNSMSFQLQSYDSNDKIKAISSKSDFLQIFLRCKRLSPEAISGNTYRGELLQLGILSPAAYFITNYLFGPGKWMGKSFSSDGCTGWNNFQVSALQNRTSISLPSQQFDIKFLPSELDKKNTLQLHYFPRNRFNLISAGMMDELRSIDDTGDILLGCGGIRFSGGMRNFAPFVLYKKMSLLRE